MNSTRSLLRPAYRVAIKEHIVEDRWTVPAATFKLCAPDETAARLMATRAAHRRAGVPPEKPLLRKSWPHTKASPNRPAQMTVPRCRVCGASLEGRRSQTLTCSSACRREAARVRAILAGSEADGYSTLAEYQARRRNRAKRR